MKKTLVLLTMIVSLICLLAFQSSASIVSEAKPISLNEETSFDFKYENSEAVYKFTPEKTDYYELTVTNFIEDNTYIYIYNESGDQIAFTSDDDFSGECYCAEKLTAGKTYYYVIHCYSYDSITQANITLVKHTHDLKTTYINEAEVGYDGYYDQECRRCDYEKSITIPKAVISFPQTSFIYTGKTITPELTIKDSEGKELKKNIDYTISGSASASKIGSYEISITLKGNYTGKKNLAYKIIPAKVTSLKASTQTASSITLTWNKVSGADGYIIYNYDSSWEEYTRLATVATNTATISKLSSGTTYKFVVKAYKKVGNTNFYGAISTMLSATTLPDTPKLKVSQTSNSITLAWGKINGASGYVVYSYDAKTKKYTRLTVVTTNKVTFSNLSSATAYCYTVRAYRKFNNKNYYGSCTALLNTATRPDKPTGLKATQTTDSITITWNKVKGATSYTVFGELDDTGITTTKNSITIKHLYSCSEYSYTVVATAKINGKNYLSTYSPILYTATRPEKPSELDIYSGKKSAKLYWYNYDCTDFQIYMATRKNGKYTKVKTINSDHAGYLNTTITNLQSGKTYYFRIRGYIKNRNTVVYGAWSSVLTAKIK